MRIGIAQLILLIAEYSGVSVGDLLGRDRTRYTVLARHAAIIVLRERAGLTYPHIARIMGNRNHATAMYAVKKDRCGDLKNLIDDINRELDMYVQRTGVYTPRDSNDEVAK